MVFCFGKVKVVLKPRLHERYFACDGDAIFLKIVASPAHGGGYSWQQILTKPVILSQAYHPLFVWWAVRL